MAKYSSRFSRFSSFRRYPAEGYVGGVCAGVAHYLDWNVRLIRALAVLTLIFGGGFPILFVYGLLWYVMERDDSRLGPSSDSPRFRARSSARHEGEDYSSFRRSSTPPTASEVKARFTRLEERLNSMEECVTSNDYELRRELRKIGA